MTAFIHRLPASAHPWVFGVEFDFNAEMVEAIKSNIPSRERTWKPEVKQWWFRANVILAVCSLADKHCGRYVHVEELHTDAAPVTAYAALHLLPSAPPEVVTSDYQGSPAKWLTTALDDVDLCVLNVKGIKVDDSVVLVRLSKLEELIHTELVCGMPKLRETAHNGNCTAGDAYEQVGHEFGAGVVPAGCNLAQGLPGCHADAQCSVAPGGMGLSTSMRADRRGEVGTD